MKFARKDYTIVLIGHADHDEVIGTLGEAPESTALVSTVEDVDRLEVADRSAFPSHPNHPEPGRNQGHREASKTAVPQDPGTEDAGHLLCHGKPAIGRQSRRSAERGSVGGGFAKQLEFAASGGSLRKDGRPGLPGGRFDRSPAAVAGGHPDRGGHGRSFGARKPGAGTDPVSPATVVSTNWKRWKSKKRTCASTCRPTWSVRCNYKLSHGYEQPSLQIADTLLAASSAALRRAAQYLLNRRTSDGYWWGDLTADTTLESDFILLQLWLHPPEDGVWNPPTRPLIDKAVQSILARQLPDGGFNIYPARAGGRQRHCQGVFFAEAGGFRRD